MNPDKVIRTDRKTISLQVTEYAELIARVPKNVSDKDLQEVIRKHDSWISKKKQEMLSKDPKFSAKQFVNGEGFLYLGKYYKLKITAESQELLFLSDQFLLGRDNVDGARELFVEWYRRAAFQKITERAELISQSTGLKFSRINITNAEKRWGSCSNRGRLNFSWRLVMAPVSVIDYVVLHELVHTSVKNHSNKFWNKVQAYMPDYAKSNEWLKQKGYLLKI